MATLPRSASISSAGSASITYMPDPVFNPPSPATTDYNTGSETVTAAATTPDAGITFSSTVAFRVTVAGTASTLSLAIDSATATIHETSATAIAGSTITVSSTDKYGNIAPVSSDTTVTLTTVNLIGSRAGFGGTSGYTGVYPYTPSGGITQSTTVKILATTSSITAASVDYYYDVDYLTESYIVASASGMKTANSVHIVTDTFATSGGTTTPTCTPTCTVHVAAGKSVTVSYKLPSATTIQANVPVWFNFTTGYTGATATGLGTPCTTSVPYACYTGSFSGGDTGV